MKLLSLESLSKRPGRGRVLVLALAAAVATTALPARADAVDTLRSFVQTVQSGRAAFTQVATSPDGAKKKTSSGEFEFQRPNRFRFDYARPYEQQIVADGQKVWLFDVDLNQVTVRPMSEALGATPAALLAGTALERDFELKAEPSAQGLEWVQAQPKKKDGSFQALRVGFAGRQLAALEIVDSFGQRSLLRFADLRTNAAPSAQAFEFTPPKGAEVLR